MNGFKMDLNIESNKIDRHTFLAPSNIVLPDSVGKIFSCFFYSFDRYLIK